MKRLLLPLMAATLLVGLSAPVAARDNVRFSISIGTPAHLHVPTVVYHAPPPPVYYVPSTSYYAPAVVYVERPVRHVVHHHRGHGRGHGFDDHRHGHKHARHRR